MLRAAGLDRSERPCSEAVQSHPGGCAACPEHPPAPTSEAVNHELAFLTTSEVVPRLMETADLVQLLVWFFFVLFLEMGNRDLEMSGKDLSRVTQLIGAKLESKPGILTCRMFHTVTRASPGTMLFLVLLQSDH